jgi:hypothetical protein
MTKRTLTRDEKRRRSKRLMWALLIVPALFVGALSAWRYSLPPPTKLDAVTLCPIGVKLRAHTVILIDKTDFHTAMHRAAIKEWIGHLKDEIGRHEMLSVRMITDRPEDAGRPVFSRCNPGDGRDLKRWRANPKKAKDLWEKSFEAPLEQALMSLLRDAEFKTSPILEALAVVAWNTTFGPDIGARRLVIASDLMQNQPDHNHYRVVPPVAAFLKTDLGRQLRSRVWTKVRIDLVYFRNATVHARQGGGHILFWQELFRKLGADDVRVIPPFAIGPKPVAAR